MIFQQVQIQASEEGEENDDQWEESIRQGGNFFAALMDEIRK